MYYKLKEEYQLRGWEKLPTGLVKKLSSEVIFLNPTVFYTLQKACSLLPSSALLLDDEQQVIIEELFKNEIIEKCSIPVPLKEEQKYKVYPNRFLYSIHWAITGNCNCRCRHCYMSAPTAKIGEFSHEQCIELIKQMKDCGVLTISLTGGEALVRQDFLEIIDALTEAGIMISTIMSNGLLVNEKLLKALADRNIKPEFNMSFDGIGCHDWLRGINGAEKAVIKAFELCQKYGLPTGAEYCLHKDNTNELRESVKLLASLGCKSLKVNRLCFEGEGVKIADKVISVEEEYKKYLDYIPEFYEDGAPLELMLSGVFANNDDKSYFIPFVKEMEDEEPDYYCLCGHARNYMHITADGYIVPCIPLGSTESGRKHFPNIVNTTLSEALKDSSYMAFIDTKLKEYFAHNPICEKCEFRNSCAGGCRGKAVEGKENADLLGRDMDACKFFKQGWYEKVTKLMKELLPS
jgi:radical SAM protein with 4Fe4S-binding SPASM domain